MDLRYAHNAIEVQDTQLCYIHSPNPGRPVILCLPGFKETVECFSHIDPYLLERFEVYMLDWRGHGRSARLEEGLYSQSQLLYDLAIFSESILPPTYWILGAELGAQIAAAWAGLHPDRVEAVVLLEGLMGIYDERALVESFRSWLSKVSTTARLQATTRERGFKDHSEVEEALAELYPTMPASLYARSAEQLTRKGSDSRLYWHHAQDLDLRSSPLPLAQAFSRALWRNIRSPVLWLYSIAGLLKPPAGLPGPSYEDEADLSLVVKEIISHFRSIEYFELDTPSPGVHRTQPEAVAKRMRAFEERVVSKVGDEG